jgi:hypothetical protein
VAFALTTSLALLFVLFELGGSGLVLAIALHIKEKKKVCLPARAIHSHVSHEFARLGTFLHLIASAGNTHRTLVLRALAIRIAQS